MARARNIKPAFFLNTELSEIEPLGRLAFIGLWTIADYKGCVVANFKKIKAQILPYDDCDIKKLMNNLEQYGFIRYYSVQGNLYLKIMNFERHQNPHKNEREAGSEIPDIDENDNSFNNLQKDGIKTDFIGTARADSLLLIPDSLKPTPAKKNKSYEDYPEFLEFWSAYPRKDDKKKSFDAWLKQKPNIDVVLNALSWQKETKQWLKDNGQFIPLGETYINGRRWEAEPPAELTGVPF